MLIKWFFYSNRYYSGEKYIKKNIVYTRDSDFFFLIWFKKKMLKAIESPISATKLKYMCLN